MKRVAITGLSGQWFDADKADYYREKSYNDGRNFISKATGSQTEHEAIYITAGGKFILRCWSNWQGSRETYEIINKEEAAGWFAKQEFSDDEIPEIFKKEVYNLEII